MKYESNILKRLIDTYGVVGNPRYISEIIKEFIVQGKERFPELFTYQADWLAHIDEFGLNPSYTVSYTGQSIYAPNTLERPVKSAILKGNTKYRDIDTGDILDTFDETKNLELVSVKLPVLTTSNEDGTKTNILTVNEEVELRGIGDVQDTLDLMTGEMTERVGEVVFNGSEEWWMMNMDGQKTNRFRVNFTSKKNNNIQNIICDKILSVPNDEWNADREQIEADGAMISIRKAFDTIKAFKEWLSQNPITVQYQLATELVKTVDLTILDQNGQNVKQLMSFNGGTHFNTKSLDGSPLPSVTVTVETDLEETLKVCSLEGNTM